MTAFRPRVSRMNQAVHMVIICCLSLALTSCAVPKVVENQQEANCKLITKEMTLDYLDIDPACYSDEACKGALILAGGSMIVSGSIVIIGNTIHWLEKQGKCNDDASVAKNHSP